MKAIGDNLIITPMQQGVEKTKGGLLLTHSQREDIRFEKNGKSTDFTLFS